MSWRWPALLLLAGFAAAVLWLAGFTLFERNARMAAAEPPPADGIVALTGGAGRVEAALRLLAEGKAPRLLVSGVGSRSELPEISHGALPPDMGRITLGRAATDTVGNATETAAWVRQNGIHSLIIVTAGYHMPRALGEIARELPDVVLHPFAIRPPVLRGRDHAASARLLANEYDKLLAAWSGLARLRRGARS